MSSRARTAEKIPRIPNVDWPSSTFRKGTQRGLNPFPDPGSPAPRQPLVDRWLIDTSDGCWDAMPAVLSLGCLLLHRLWLPHATCAWLGERTSPPGPTPWSPSHLGAPAGCRQVTPPRGRHPNRGACVELEESRPVGTLEVPLPALALLDSQGRALATVPTRSGVEWDVVAVSRHPSQDPLFGKEPDTPVHEGGTLFL